MVSLLLGVVLATTPPLPRLAATGFQRAGLSPEVARLVEDALVNRLVATRAVLVTTQADVAAALGLERQRQLLGCSDESTSCLAELAGALGVDGVLTGSIGRVGDRFQLNVKVTSARDARTLFVYASPALESEGRLLDEAGVAARAIADHFEALPGARADRATGWAPWLLAGAGAAVAVTGGLFAGLAAGDLAALRTGELPTGATPETVRDQGQLRQGLALGLLAGGGLALLSGALWKALAPGAPVEASLGVEPGGASALVRVPLP